MINITKLLKGRGTISEVLKYSSYMSRSIKPELIRFSEKSRPVVIWNITWRCNLNCLHCYVPTNIGNSVELHTEDVFQVISELVDMKIPLLILSGGEPLLRPDILDIIKFASECGLRVGLSTNGTLINRNMVRRLAEAGVAYIGISLDGASRYTHDYIRGVKGAYERALNGIRNCLKYNIKTGIRTIISKRTINEIPQIIDIATRLGVSRLCFYHIVPTGRGKEYISENISNEERVKLIAFLCEVASLYDATEILTVCNPADGVYVYKYAAERDEELSKIIYKLLKASGGCSAGTKICCIGPDGSVYPCQFMNEYPVGNILKSSLKEIWSDDNDLLKPIRDRRLLKGMCGKCEYRDICGGCRVRAYYYNGSYLAFDPGCYVYDGS